MNDQNYGKLIFCQLNNQLILPTLHHSHMITHFSVSLPVSHITKTQIKTNIWLCVSVHNRHSEQTFHFQKWCSSKVFSQHTVTPWLIMLGTGVSFVQCSTPLVEQIGKPCGQQVSAVKYTLLYSSCQQCTLQNPQWTHAVVNKHRSQL